MAELGCRFDVQMFATDMDPHAIETARTGTYPAGIADDVGPERLERFFSATDGTYRVRSEIREMVIFAVHNVLEDPPFTKLDLLSCRNLLIYLQPELQKKLLPLFHYALQPGGVMFLGSSESLGNYGEHFEVIDGKSRLFHRLDSPLQPPPHFARFDAPPRSHQDGMRRQRGFKGSVHDVAERALLDSLVPPTVVVNEQGNILHIHGRTGKFLEPNPGEPSNNIFAMAREGLELELSAALHRASSEQGEIHHPNVRVRSNGGITSVDLHVRQLQAPEALRGLYLVSFHPAALATHAGKGRSEGKEPSSDREATLEQELQRTKETLQTPIGEYQTTNEELKSSNEELQSTNEELQSTNEELETSKEETQSLNEELQTVNAELQDKIEDLSRSHDDMNNLLNSTQIATLFLDNELHVKRYTPQAKNVANLIPSDVGRPISDLATKIEYDALAGDAQEVLRTLVYKEIEITSHEGAWYLMRMMPYRTTQNVIDGLVITFVDISDLKQTEQRLERASNFADAIVQTIPSPLLILDLELRVVEANDAFAQAFELDRDQVRGRLVWKLAAGLLDSPELREQLQTVVSGDGALEGFELQHDYPGWGPRRLVLNARMLQVPGRKLDRILLMFDDVTHRQGSQKAGR
jgi:two-component system CheB/CheR fusion protein